MATLENPQAFLRQLFDAAVLRAQPLHNLAAYLPTPPDLGKGCTLVLGAGKAAGAMAQALEALWPHDAPLSGLVVTRYGHTPARPAGVLHRIEVLEAAHPVPDAAGVAASERMLGLAQGLGAHDLVICLISGGGSALLTLPATGLALADKQRISRDLLASGATIGEMNCVRKHLSRIKGGRLAAACHPARVVTLCISDVPGDDPSTIASGPTVPDATTCAQALAILKRYAIGLPPLVHAALESGALETPKPGDTLFAGHAVQVIATPMQSLRAAAVLARQMGLNAYILSDEIEGESREVGRVHGAIARTVAQQLPADSVPAAFCKPCVILSGGETTVTLRSQPPHVPPGRGGRAGEFGLGLAQALQGQPNVWALVADTDGIDGVEDNAGVFVTPDTLARAQAAGLGLAQHADRNDAYSFFSALDDLLVTGPTHTNVNDFRALLVL
ncbi:MAG: glycerate kinase type-2 family protein [Burkholderiales bacterium]